MILVDTSIWIDFFRGKNKQRGIHLQTLLDEDQVALAAPIRIEILSGCSNRDLPRLRLLFSALPLLIPAEDVWYLLESWVQQGILAGEKFGMGDLLIAGIAAQNDISIWSLDFDFERMAALGWITLHQLSK